MTLGKIPRSRFLNPLTVSTFPSNSFLNDVSVYDVDCEGQLVGAIGSAIERLAYQSLQSGSAEVTTDHQALHSDASAAVAIPVYRDQRIVSIAVLSSKQLSEGKDDLVGVFEVWEPVGIYEELGLKRGFYGRMERFHNVSSFVRFEKGNGLPGLVWQQHSSVIHDDLSNHPSFLRAAGASADLLKTAIGIPVVSSRFHSTAVLISSGVSPIARGFEIWQAEDNRFSLLGSAYHDLKTESDFALPTGFTLHPDAGMPGLANLHGGAILCNDSECFLAGRGPQAASAGFVSGLAIPFFEGESLTSVTTLLF